MRDAFRKQYLHSCRTCTLAGISRFERDLISQRTMEGLASARAGGRKGSRPTKDKKDIEAAIKMYNSRLYSIAGVEKTTGASKATLYRYIKKQG